MLVICGVMICCDPAGVVSDEERKSSHFSDYSSLHELTGLPRHLYHACFQHLLRSLFIPTFPPPFEPWAIPRKAPGPIILTLPKSHIGCTSPRRRISLELSSARYSMVRRPVSVSRAHLSRSFSHPRDRCRSIFPMYRRVVLSGRSNKWGYQMATCGSHRGHVLICDDIHRDELRPSIHLQYQ